MEFVVDAAGLQTYTALPRLKIEVSGSKSLV